MPSSRITPGGTAIQALPVGVTTWPVIAATSGTDTTPVAGTIYYASVWIEGDLLLTGLNILLGSASTNGTVIVGIAGSDGAVVATSALAGTTTTTAAQTQTVNLTAPTKLLGPGYYLLFAQFSSTSDRFRSVPAFCDNGIMAGSQTGVTGTIPSSLTVSATKFTADKGPVMRLV
jgi:hypothetical protein